MHTVTGILTQDKADRVLRMIQEKYRYPEDMALWNNFQYRVYERELEAAAHETDFPDVFGTQRVSAAPTEVEAQALPALAPEREHFTEAPWPAPRPRPARPAVAARASAAKSFAVALADPVGVAGVLAKFNDWVPDSLYQKLARHSALQSEFARYVERAENAKTPDEARALLNAAATIICETFEIEGPRL